MPDVLFNHNVPMRVVMSPLTLTVPLLLKVTLALLPDPGPVILLTAILPALASKVKVDPAVRLIAPTVKSPLELIV